MRSAVVAAVDPGFQSRAGVDPFTLVGAAWHDIAGGGGGNTTITQRYVASALLDDDESLPQPAPRRWGCGWSSGCPARRSSPGI